MMERSSVEIFDRNFADIKSRIETAARKSGRAPGDITLLAATKTVDVDLIDYAVKNGIDYIGENRVQEFLKKEPYYPPVHKHFIGHLQTNKVKDIVGKVELIHSVDSLHLTEEISRQSQKKDIISDILIEVNIGSEESKHGFTPDEVIFAAGQIAKIKGVRLRGLMAIPPICQEANENVNFFKEMNKLFIDIKGKKIDNSSIDILSMGMSDDFEQAIECGATIVRIGTSLFGKRNYG